MALCFLSIFSSSVQHMQFKCLFLNLLPAYTCFTSKCIHGGGDASLANVLPVASHSRHNQTITQASVCVCVCETQAANKDRW